MAERITLSSEVRCHEITFVDQSHARIAAGRRKLRDQFELVIDIRDRIAEISDTIEKNVKALLSP